ncbi:Receptor-like protein kinase FERONIA [Glycine soja]|nr:Receptor-like protein kinase FERONIA [Glycine soja]
MGDTDSMLLSSQDSTVSAKPTSQSPSTNHVPFTTARLSRSQFNYSFPVTPGPKFLRLFFYPASYPSFPHTDSSFKVQCNQFLLLDSFNASLNVDAVKKETIFREYIVYVGDNQMLILSFTPFQPNSYAFINGIEVFSMPSYLYYTSATDTGFTFVGSGTLFSIQSSAVLETYYRIKVGGQGISPGNDTGLFRNWIGHDEDYLITHNLKNNLPGDTDAKMNIIVNPDYVAPKELYSIARDMGSNATLNKISNLIWEFPVDSGCTYMIRLHFCELDPHVYDIGDRVFFIYIASQLAESGADVMSWSQKQKGLAVYKDYAILIPKNDTEKKVNLSLQMHPYQSSWDTEYSGPFLNGLEIFKISDFHLPVQEGHDSMLPVTLWVVSGVFFVLFLFISATYERRQLLLSTNKSINTEDSSLPSDDSHLCRRFSIVEIKVATKNFDDVLIVGVGGFGHVYKGYIDGSSNPVAIKRLKPGSQQGAREFLNEIEMLSELRHRHLVSLIGYCSDDNEMILVYDFMTRGNLRDHLYDTDNPPLSWKQRLQICIGAARGLRYLHSGAKHMIIHRDVKTTNILLDEKWVAKVSDFGLSRIGPTDMSKSHVSTAVKGSFGYLDPEYYNRQRLTEKSDVYSFGVVLFEILCARPPLIHTAEPEELSLANWARYCYQSGTLVQIVDPMLKGSIVPECFTKFCEIGVSCLLQDGMHRPSMNDVVSMLESALQLQEGVEQLKNVGIVTVQVHEERKGNGDNVFNSNEHDYHFKDSDTLLRFLRDNRPKDMVTKWN